MNIIRLLARQCLIILVLTLAVCVNAGAVSLSVDPATRNYNVGDSVNVDIRVSGMENEDLAAFDFFLEYDDSVLDFDSYLFGDSLGDIGTTADDWSMGDLGNGRLHFSELSWLWDFDFQPDEFVLASLTFNGTGAGDSLLSLASVVLGNSGASPLLDVNISNGMVGVASNEPVPEPASLLLTGVGLLSASWFRKKKVS